MSLLNFPSKLVEAKLVKRYKRFFADAELADGSYVTAHCPNTGSMKTCGEPGDTILLLHNPSPTRKLAYTWELTRTKGGFIGVNTARPNSLVREAIEAGLVPELQGYATIQSEVTYGTRKSRVDLLLTNGADARPCFVEIKNCTLRHGDAVVFPDAVSERALKHVHELVDEVNKGSRSVLFFLVNRPDGSICRAADHIHPEYAQTLRDAVSRGLEVVAYRAVHSRSGMKLGERVPFVSV